MIAEKGVGDGGRVSKLETRVCMILQNVQYAWSKKNGQDHGYERKTGLGWAKICVSHALRIRHGHGRVNHESKRRSHNEDELWTCLFTL